MNKTSAELFQEMHRAVDEAKPEPRVPRIIPEKIRIKFLPMRKAVQKATTTVQIRFTGNAVAKRLPPENN